jgi:hypothetical protein
VSRPSEGTGVRDQRDLANSGVHRLKAQHGVLRVARTRGCEKEIAVGSGSWRTIGFACEIVHQSLERKGLRT